MHEGIDEFIKTAESALQIYGTPAAEVHTGSETCLPPSAVVAADGLWRQRLGERERRLRVMQGIGTIPEIPAI